MGVENVATGDSNLNDSPGNNSYPSTCIRYLQVIEDQQTLLFYFDT